MAAISTTFNSGAPYAPVSIITFYHFAVFDFVFFFVCKNLIDYALQVTGIFVFRSAFVANGYQSLKQSFNNSLVLFSVIHEASVTLMCRIVFSFNLSLTKFALDLLILTLNLAMCKKLIEILCWLVFALSALKLRLIANTHMLLDDVIANLVLAKRTVNCHSI